MMNSLQYRLYFLGRLYVELGLIGDGSEFQGYFVIFLYIFFKNNVVEIVNKMSTLHIHIRDPDCIQAFLSWML